MGAIDHAVMVTTRDPTGPLDHGRMTVLATALEALQLVADRVTVVHLRDQARNPAPDGVERIAIPVVGAPTRLVTAVSNGVRSRGSLNGALGLSRSQCRWIVEAVDGPVDLWYVDGVRCAPLLAELDNSPTLLDLDDLLSLRYRRWAQLRFDDLPFDLIGTQPGGFLNVLGRVARRFVPLVLRVEAGRVAGVERRATAMATITSLVSAREADLWSSSTGTRVVALPMARPFGASRTEPASEVAEWDACFVGHVSHLPNLAGLAWFADEVVPLLEKRLDRPPRVAVAGRCPERVQQWLSERGFEPLGFVDDLAELFRSSACAIAPQVVAGGINTKVLDAAAHHAAIVSRSEAAEGFGSDAAPWAVVDDPLETAVEVARCVEDSHHRVRLGEAGRAFVGAAFERDAVLARWVDAFHGCLELGD